MKDVKVLIQKGKYSDNIFDISTDELKFGAALSILQSNIDIDHYHDKPTLRRVVKILNKRDGREAWDFIMMRSNKGYEYEYLEITKLFKRKP